MRTGNLLRMARRRMKKSLGPKKRRNGLSPKNMFNVNVAIEIIVLSNRTLFNVVIREGRQGTPFRLNNKLGKIINRGLFTETVNRASRRLKTLLIQVEIAVIRRVLFVSFSAD